MRAIEIAGRDQAAAGIHDAGPAPILQWLKISDLVIDESYQRELKRGNWTAIRKIAASFRWSRFSPVFVAPIEGGKFAIIDGQHRTHAALMCGVSEVPCQIVPMDRSEQAAAFAAVNGLVTRVTTWQIFRAAATAGEAWAAAVDKAAADAGCKVMRANQSHWLKKPGEIYAVVVFRGIVETYGAAAVTAALKVLMAADGYRDNPEAWDNQILRPVLAAFCQRQPALGRDGFAAALEQFDIFAAAEQIDEENRRRRRLGLPYAPKYEQLERKIIAWIDRKFPARMALPAPARAAK